MIQNIIKSEQFLQEKSENATQEDAFVIQDLIDTLMFHKERCLGLAANMIGQKKRILAFFDGETICVMVNPEIMKKEGLYLTEEGCISLTGVRPTKRYQKIKVRYWDAQFKIKIKTYTGLSAQVIQHEMDHFEGILI